ncbi:YdcF family protein [Gymnodinialimonas hymeniacidonis]|uniref:YdcF family protein n=1 Tax=Gymnodinialimonas hymeniacidonis TaxID=3126508 RepID=UPI0034C6AC2D
MTAIVILGAAVWPNGPSPTLRRRVLHGAALYHAGRGACVVVCGGLGRHPPTEAEAMAALLRDEGVPETAIHLEDRSTNTSENLRFALPILERLGQDHILVVSDAYHLPRASMIARRLGLHVTGSAPPMQTARLWPQVKGWLREGPGLVAVLLRIR